MKDQPHETGGLYVHIPFCKKKCPYCDFYSITDLALSPRYLRALTAEMQHSHSEFLNFDTIYIGGGTPSVLSSTDIRCILETAFECFQILQDPEITIEVNPGTVSLAQFKSFRHAGVNRLNIGVQSFQEKNLTFLERIHSVKDAKLAFERAQQAGFANLGMDLIYGLPEQSKKNWLVDLEYAIRLRPDHLSCYMLTCEPGTPLHRNLQSGRYHPLHDRKVRELFYLTIEYLEDHGYDHYEISNFARKTTENRPSRVSAHNSKYWSLAPYLGIGASAHSFIEPRRWWNNADVKTYIQKTEAGHRPIEANETLTTEQLIMEVIYLSLRTRSGIDIEAFDQKFELDFLQIFEDIIINFENEGMLQKEQKRIKLTRKGMAYLDSITSVFTSREIYPR